MGCSSSTPVVEAPVQVEKRIEAPAVVRLETVLPDLSSTEASKRADARAKFNEWTSSEAAFADLLKREGAKEILVLFIAAIKRERTDHPVRLKLLALLASHSAQFGPCWDSSTVSGLVAGILQYPMQYPEDVFVFGADIMYVMLRTTPSPALKAWMCDADIWLSARHTLRTAQGRPQCCIAMLNLCSVMVEKDVEQVKTGLCFSGTLVSALELLSNCVVVAEQAAATLPSATAAADVLARSPAPSILRLLHAAVQSGDEAVQEVAKAATLSPVLSLARQLCTCSESLPGPAADLLLSTSVLLLSFVKGRAAGREQASSRSSRFAIEREQLRMELVQSGLPSLCLSLLHVQVESGRAEALQQLAAAILDCLTAAEERKASVAASVSPSWLSAPEGAPQPPKLPPLSPLLTTVLDPCAGCGTAPSAAHTWHALIRAAVQDMKSGRRVDIALSVVSLLARAACSQEGLRALALCLQVQAGADSKDCGALLAELYLACEPCSYDGLSPSPSTALRRRLGPLLWQLASERARLMSEVWARRRAAWRRWRLKLANDDSEDEGQVAPRPSSKPAVSSGYSWSSSGSWACYHTSSGIPYYEHRGLGTVQWARPTGESPSHVDQAMDIDCPLEEDACGLGIVLALQQGGYFKSGGEAHGAGACMAEGAALLRSPGARRAEEAASNKTWRADDVILRLSMCAIACESLCEAAYLHPSGQASQGTGGEKEEEALREEMAAEDEAHWPTVKKQDTVVELLSFIKECTASLEASRCAGFSLGHCLYPSAPVMLHNNHPLTKEGAEGTGVGTTLSSAGSSESATGASLDASGGVPGVLHSAAGSGTGCSALPLLITQEVVASLARLARCEQYTEVTAFAAWVIREAVTASPAPSSSSGRDWKEIESRLMESAPVLPLDLAAMQMKRRRTGLGEGAVEVLPPFGWPLLSVPLLPAVPLDSPVLACVSTLQDVDASIAALASGTLGRTGTAAVMASLQVQRAHVLQTLMMQQRAAASCALACSSKGAGSTGSGSRGGVGVHRGGKSRSVREGVESPPVAVLANSVPASDADFCAPLGPSLLLPLFTQSWLGQQATVLLSSPEQGAGSATCSSSAGSAALCGTLWQYPWSTALTATQARDALEVCGAKVGLRATMFRLKLLQPIAPPPVPTPGAAAVSGLGQGLTSPKEGAQAKAGVLGRLFSSPVKVAEPSSSSLLSPSSSSTPGAAADSTGGGMASGAGSGGRKALLQEVERGLASVDGKTGTWPMALYLIQQSLLAMTFSAEDAPAAAADTVATTIVSQGAKDAFLRLKAKGEARRLAAIAARAAEAKTEAAALKD